MLQYRWGCDILILYVILSWRMVERCVVRCNRIGQSSFSAEQVAWHLACRKQDSTTLLCMSGIKIPVIILGRTFRPDTKALNRGMSIKRMFVRFAIMGYLEKSIWYLVAHPASRSLWEERLKPIMTSVICFLKLFGLSEKSCPKSLSLKMSRDC